jgi:hypothetical protein
MKRLSPCGIVTDKVRNLYNQNDGDPLKIAAELLDNYSDLRRDAVDRDIVRNENTFSASLTTNFLIARATTQASPKFAALDMFARSEDVDPYKPLATGQMKFNTTTQSGSTTQTNATNFESGDSVVTNVPITVNQYTESFHITNSQLNDGLRLADLVDAKMADLGSKVAQVLTSNITAANFNTLTPIIRDTGAFGFSDMQTAWGTLKKARRKNIMLDGPYLANLINIPTLFQQTPVVPGAGWKNLFGWDYVALHTEWTQAGNNILGFACDPQALGVIVGLPLMDVPGTNGILGMANGTLVSVNCPLQAYTWFNTGTRTYWGSFDLMFGAVALDTTIGMVIATGTPS